MIYMPYIIALISAFCMFNDAWRRTAFIVFIASIFNIFFISPFVVPEYIMSDGTIDEDLYFVAGLVDAITAYLILKFGRGGKYLQAGVLSLFVLVNASLLIELKTQSFLVYNFYEQLIFMLNIAQIALFGSGVKGALKRVIDYVDSANRVVAGNTLNSDSGRYNSTSPDKKILEHGE